MSDRSSNLASCTLCPRRCGVDRRHSTGFCGETGTVRLARAALHMWEEPPVSGRSGSGTVFFTGCPLKCSYCQNAAISTGRCGKEISISRLSEIFLEQQMRGALNINLVTPTHFVYQILDALDTAKTQGLVLPIVYNTSGYETPETLDLLKGYVDIFLTDFKYASSNLSRELSCARDYPEVASAALDKMFEIVGPYTLGDDPRPEKYRTCAENEVLLKGVIVRHLLLPGHLDDSKAVMLELALKPYIDSACVSIMSQYTPMSGVLDTNSGLAHTVDPFDYDELIDYALELGLENSFMQEGGAAEESFIPDFGFQGV